MHLETAEATDNDKITFNIVSLLLIKLITRKLLNRYLHATYAKNVSESKNLEAALCFMSLNISPSQSGSLKITGNGAIR